MTGTQIFEQYESEVRSYCRSFPTVFTRAKGARIWDEAGKEYLDFFAGAGALNYGHNPDNLKRALVDYLLDDQITHSLDMHTQAKAQLIETMQDVILKPRNMNYKTMFTGPTGTNAVESALKLARKVKQRQNVVYFTNGFHGMTLGSLSVTGNAMKRNGAGVSLSNTTAMPFCGYYDNEVDTIQVLERFLADSSSGLDHPAAFIVETVQAEGGVNAASLTWLKKLSDLAKAHDILLIIDDIQVGCGRTGSFFSFEGSGIEPDMICLSKSLSAYGTPMALVLIKPELDQWQPGEHNGTFRGHNLAFVTARQAMLDFWRDDHLSKSVRHKSQLAQQILQGFKTQLEGEEIVARVKGRGLILGLAFEDASLPGKIAAACYERGLIIETAGPQDEVLKLLPSLTITEAELMQGLRIIAEALTAVTGCTIATPEAQLQLASV
ncbi:MAG: diaminobutyrate--2-oxoglutarate transaminase [Candidatus Sericytochromatia bacterium]|nr:diaminobutyrate--2-oxoglutarate transaminase [Candidatus Sericytochromatia bacterium]